jgi:hypothetical protein
MDFILWRNKDAFISHTTYNNWFNYMLCASKVGPLLWRSLNEHKSITPELRFLLTQYSCADMRDASFPPSKVQHNRIDVFHLFQMILPNSQFATWLK